MLCELPYSKWLIWKVVRKIQFFAHKIFYAFNKQMGQKISTNKVDIDKIISSDINSPARILIKFSEVGDIFLEDEQQKIADLVVKILKKDKTINFRIGEEDDPDVIAIRNLYLQIEAKVAEKRHLAEHDIVWQQASMIAKMGINNVEQLKGLKKMAEDVGLRGTVVDVTLTNKRSIAKLAKGLAEKTYSLRNYIFNKYTFTATYGAGPMILYKTCTNVDMSVTGALKGTFCVAALAGYIWFDKPLGGLLERYLRHSTNIEDISKVLNKEGIPEYIFTNSIFMATAKVIGAEIIPVSLKGYSQLKYFIDKARTPLVAGISVLNTIPASREGLINMKDAVGNYVKASGELLVQWGISVAGNIKDMAADAYESGKVYVEENIELVKTKAFTLLSDGLESAQSRLGGIFSKFSSLSGASVPPLISNTSQKSVAYLQPVGQIGAVAAPQIAP
jgi:hypothetical protein